MKPTISGYMALPGLKFNVQFAGHKNPDRIISAVCEFLYVTRRQLEQKTRKRYIVEARQIAMYLIRKHSSKSMQHIGSIFGGRDHTTAIHSIQVVNDLCDSNEQYKQRLLQIENLL